MKKIVLLSFILCAFYFTTLSQTIEGPVLKKELAGKYEGGQKKGLAHGTGTAIGIDSYTGEFKKGLPDGDGVYTDSQGNVFKGSFRLGKKEGKGIFTPVQSANEQPMIGYWEDDKYVGKEKIEPYVISNKTGACNPRIYAAGPGNKIEISAINPVNSSYLGINIFMIGKATDRYSSGRYYYEECSFPIEFDMNYNSSNKLGTAMIANTVRIKINKPGNWVITLRN
ncbi:MAG: hypothetical protein HXX14_00925 [Bacteroidetes bacterium]|nr:hypothetical protein [Bacteroidota bacterium]